MENKNMNPAAKTEETSRFEKLMRDFETAYASGEDFTSALYALAEATALSVVKKCLDPQRKAAVAREEVSNSGSNPALSAVRRDIRADTALFENTAAAHAAAYNWKFDNDGYVVSEVVDKDAEKAAAALQGETFGDGIDLVHTAAIALMEVAAAHASESGWMEKPYTARRIARKVYVKLDDTAAWTEEETSPIREVYRTVRREVQNSRAMQTDPRNGYLYIEDVAADPESDALETIYRRLGKWADLGGYTCDMNGQPKYDGVYTADMQTAMDYNDIIERLALTDRQNTIVRMRMQGYGVRAIATYLGVNPRAVYNAMEKVQAKCEKIGFTPDMWAEMNK